MMDDAGEGSSSSPKRGKIMSLTDDTEKWDNDFLRHHDILEKNGVINTPRTRIAILSGTDSDVNDNCSINTVFNGKKRL